MEVRIRVNSPAFERILERLKALPDNLEEALKIAGIVGYGLIAEKFRKQGPGWAPLGERTKLRRRGGKSQRILEDSGRLRTSITSQTGTDSVYVLRNRELLIGTNVKYAPAHQYGSEKQRIPARPFIPEVPEILPRAERNLKRWLDEYLSR